MSDECMGGFVIYFKAVEAKANISCKYSRIAPHGVNIRNKQIEELQRSHGDEHFC